jgi:precorrin-2/cobalt-factor-2 C20-methyltransferase
VLESADLVIVPVLAACEQGYAERTVRAHISHDRVRRAVFALSDRGGRSPERIAAWTAAADVVVEAFDAGADVVAFATIGDPNVYSTFTYLAGTVRERRPDVTVSTVPGITAMQALAAASGVPLCEGSEPLTLLPVTGDLEILDAALDSGASVVAYKAGSRNPAVLEVLRRHDRLGTAVVGTRLGLAGERVHPAAAQTDVLPYLSTMFAPAPRSGVGGKL